MEAEIKRYQLGEEQMRGQIKALEATVQELEVSRVLLISSHQSLTTARAGVRFGGSPISRAIRGAERSKNIHCQTSGTSTQCLWARTTFAR